MAIPRQRELGLISLVGQLHFSNNIIEKILYHEKENRF